jgi:hypothetical protein
VSFFEETWSIARAEPFANGDAPTLQRQAIPQEFQTRSRVVIIANEWKTLNGNVTAGEGPSMFLRPYKRFKDGKEHTHDGLGRKAGETGCRQRSTLLRCEEASHVGP